MTFHRMVLGILVPLLLAPLAFAQVQNPAQVQVQRGGDNPIYKITINVVERQTTAVNYRHRGGSTRLDFRGTPLLASAHGEVDVEGRKGYMEIKAEFKDLQPATRFGPEYLTYVLWAITPEGRPVNLGEVLLDGSNRGVLDVTTDLQAFGMIVTAEPYFAVTQPSDVVVLENFVRPDTKGIVEQVNAKYELLKRGQYTVNVPPAELKPIQLEKNKPLDLYEAQNAIRIARWAGADKDAADSFAKAQGLLQQAEGYQAKDPGSKPVSTTARGAAQSAEDARLIAMQRQEEARLAKERADAAEREAQAKAAADQAKAAADQSARQTAEAEQQQRLEAERRARAESERAQAEAEAQRNRAEAERNRAEAEKTRAEAEVAAQKAAQDRQTAQAEVDRARQLADQAQRDQQQLRQQLVDQFNRILETRDTARGLIVNMRDVLFDTGQFTLKPTAREQLAKIAGIILAHPGLKIEVEGHTDSVGSDSFNQVLSEKRANVVRDFLVSAGIPADHITASGRGDEAPIVTNKTA
ncbi:MAG TPA: OmpA family protein, partial [Terriglobia bacterium]|nr:OmpA family protein [Terriglobia bacterium]